MEKIIFLISILIFTQAIKLTYSQPCANFHKSSTCYSFDPTDPDYKLYGQSTSGLVEVKRTFTYNLVFYGGMDYKFSVCSKDNLRPIHFVLIDKETGETLYDNETEEYNEAISFTMDETKSVTVKITAIAKNVNVQSAKDLRGCVGIVVLWKKVPKVGFPGGK